VRHRRVARETSNNAGSRLCACAAVCGARTRRWVALRGASLVAWIRRALQEVEAVVPEMLKALHSEKEGGHHPISEPKLEIIHEDTLLPMKIYPVRKAMPSNHPHCRCVNGWLMQQWHQPVKANGVM